MLPDYTLGNYVANSFNPEFLMNKVVQIMNMWYNDTECYIKLSQKCRTVAEQYSWDIIAKDFAKLLSSLCSKDKRRKIITCN